jgi:hypothetical protein
MGILVLIIIIIITDRAARGAGQVHGEVLVRAAGARDGLEVRQARVLERPARQNIIIIIIIIILLPIISIIILSLILLHILILILILLLLLIFPAPCRGVRNSLGDLDVGAVAALALDLRHGVAPRALGARPQVRLLEYRYHHHHHHRHHDHHHHRTHLVISTLGRSQRWHLTLDMGLRRSQSGHVHTSGFLPDLFISTDMKSSKSSGFCAPHSRHCPSATPHLGENYVQSTLVSCVTLPAQHLSGSISSAIVPRRLYAALCHLRVCG